MPRNRGILETPSIWSAEEVAPVQPDALETPLSPPAPRRNVRRLHISVAPSSKPVAMFLITAIGMALGCLALYLILGFTLAPKWLESLFDRPQVIDHSSPSSSVPITLS